MEWDTFVNRVYSEPETESGFFNFAQAFGNEQELTRELVCGLYCRSWENLADSFGSALNRFDDQRNLAHWRKVIGEIRVLANMAEKYK